MTSSATLQPVVIIDNYDSFTYNLFQMVQAQTKRDVKVFRNDAITLDELIALKPDRIILSPGPGHPAVESDFRVCRDIITQWDRLGCPLLGVCLGHQGIVQHLGGQVTQAPSIVHGKTSDIFVTFPSPLFEGLPMPFQAMRYHSLVAADTAEESHWPDCLEITAREKKDNLVMALQHKNKPIYGVQFHPESIGTPEGAQLLLNFLERCHAL